MPEDARLNAIWLDIVAALKTVVREHRITQDELHAAGDYFNRLGQSGMCRSLIDVALAMTSVEVTGGADAGTRPNLEGPYHAPHPERADGNLVDRDLPADAPRLTLSGTVTDVATGAPVAGALLDFWQADADGLYDRGGTHLRGLVHTDDQGRYRIKTVVPSDYSEHDSDPIGELFRAMGKENIRAAHIHLKASVGGQVVLTTQLFMSSSTYLHRDYVEGAVSEDLVVHLQSAGARGYAARFDVALAFAKVAA